MNTQRENVRRAFDVTKGGENANPTSTTTTGNAGIKPLGLSAASSTTNNSKRINLPSQLKLQEHINYQRKILSDKSNKGGHDGLSKSNIQQSIKQKESITKVFVDNNEKVATSITVKIEDTQQDQIAVSTEKSTTQEFFDDNKSRYKQEEQDIIGVVPILPIVVPKKMRHLFEKHNTSAKVGTKRPATDQLEQDDNEPLEKKKLKSTATRFFAPNAPALDIEITEETKIFERQQETRAKLAMLQTTQSLKEHQWNDPMIVAEYAGEIFGYLFDSEPKLMADPIYALNLQHEVTWKMRSVLIDWVIEIHYLFQLLPETLFLAVNIIDRFLSLRTVVLGKLQLVGITSLFIATKFEEMSCPTMQDFLFMTDNAVKEDELIKAERFILQVLDFHLCYPNPLNFLRRVCTDELKCDVHTRTLAKYFMEISCIDHTFIGIRPSKIAAAALWLSKKMLAKGKWGNSYTKLAGYSPEELKSTVEAMLDYLSQPVTHDAFFKKWSSIKFSKASIFVRDWINRYYIN